MKNCENDHCVGVFREENKVTLTVNVRDRLFSYNNHSRKDLLTYHIVATILQLSMVTVGLIFTPALKTEDQMSSKSCSACCAKRKD